MTMLRATIEREPGMAASHPSFEVRWSCAITSYSDRFGTLLDGGARHGRIAFVISIELIDLHHGLLEAWMEWDGRRRTVLAGRPVSCEVLRDGELLHVDVRAEGGRRMLAVSLGGDLDRPVFAQSPLLAEAGLFGGTYDPPTVRRFAARRDAASA